MIAVLNAISEYAIPMVLLFIPLYALIKGVKVYSVFTEGAKDGLTTAITIVPYLVCMLGALGMFRASGAMDWLVKAINPITSLIGLPGEVLPMGIMRSFSGGGAEGMMSDLITTFGTQSQIGRIASVALGSTETTFYIVAVYFGCVGITNVRHSIIAGLLGDVASLIAAAVIVNVMWF